MKFLIVCSLLTFTLACKKENLTSNNGLMPFMSKSYLNLPHKEDQSILRRKLLHLRLGQVLHDDSSEEIDASDVFEILGSHFRMSKKKQEEYNQLKASCAELIISFIDHLEIYFVPTGIDREIALKQIGITLPTGANISWNEGTPLKLLKGNIYYLLSSTDNEMKNNDIYFHSEKNNLGEKYQDIEFTFSLSQQVILDFDTQYLENQVGVANREGAKIKCTKDILEAGLCNPCSYKIQTVTGGLIERAFKLEEINLSIMIDGKEFSLQELDASIDSKNHILVVLNFKKLTKNNLVKVTILNSAIKPISRQVEGFDFSDSCYGRNAKSTLDLTPVINKSLEMEIQGRVFEF